jgi:hypothetical protein
MPSPVPPTSSKAHQIEGDAARTNQDAIAGTAIEIAGQIIGACRGDGEWAAN